MKKIIGDFSTEVIMEGDEPTTICRLGKGSECCAFLVVGAEGFKCIRLAYPSNSSIFSRLESGKMVANGEGGWAGCAWEGEL